VDLNGVQHAQTTADATGVFQLRVSPDVQGFIQCSPPLLPELRLSTFVSTAGKAAGETIPEVGREEISPPTTVVAELIMAEMPADPQARKAQLVTAIANQDPAITTLVDTATALYKPLLEAQVNVDFGTDNGETGDGGGGGDGDDGGDGSPGDGGGVGGNSDDGGETSPIPNAVCDFALLPTGAVFVTTVLHDLFTNGVITRPDIGAVASQVNQQFAARAAEITSAFAALFPNGIGRPLSTVAAGAGSATPGSYFLPIPPGIPGFIRCRPPNQERLLLITSVRARGVGESLTGQDVTPQTTAFSTNIANTLQDAQGIIKQNYLDDITGLRVRVVQAGGNVVAFEIVAPENVADADVGIVAFSAVSLFNALFRNGNNVDFPAALNDLVNKAVVDPSFLETLGVPAPQADTLAGVVNDSITTAEADLGTALGSALSTARIQVTVTDAVSGGGLQGAAVDIQDPAGSVQCANCPGITDENGAATLTLTGVPVNNPAALAVTASLVGFTDDSEQTTLVAFATVDVSLTLSPLSSLAVTPVNPVLAVNATQQFSAIGTFVDGSTRDLTADVAWSSSNTGVAAISNAVGSEGRAVGLAAGNTVITATFDGISDMTTLTVTSVPTAGCPPPMPTLSFGDIVECAIDTPGEQDLFTITAAAGERLRFVMTATGPIVPRLEVFASDGSVVGAGQNFGQAVLDVTLPLTGTYTLVARDVGTAAGGYILTLARIIGGGCVP
jgi:hypothetical protein